MNSFAAALVAAVFISCSFAAPTSKSTPSTDSMVIMERTMSVGSLDQFMIVFGVSPCMASCALELNNQFNSTTNEEAEANFEESCDEYLAASGCFQRCPEADDHIFDIISSGADFMCVEQREAFERAMPCIREHRKEMKEECREKCAPSEEKMKLLEQGPITASVDEEEQWSNSSALYDQVSVLCEVMHCTIGCGRDMLNERCDRELRAGDLVTEVMIRPLEKNAEFLKGMGPDVEETVRKALPPTCSFIVDQEQLEAFRHGPVFRINDLISSTTATTTPFRAEASTTAFHDPISSETFAPDSQDLQRLENRERRSISRGHALASSALAASSAMKMLL